MMTNFVSTLSLRSAPRTDFNELQTSLARASREVATGRLDDPGAVLGARTSRSVELRTEDGLIGRLIASNGVANARMDQSQAALDGIVDGANGILEALTALPPSSTAVEALGIEGRAALEQLVVGLNASNGRSYLFGGINADVRPINEYDTGARAAVEAAVTAAFGSATIPPGTGPAAVNAFLTGPFAAEFADPAWANNWSNASDTNIENEIEDGFVVETSVNANEQPFRDLAMAYTMLGHIGMENLRSDARQVIIDRAISLAGEAVEEIVKLQAELGLTQNAVTDAVDRMEAQQVIIVQQLAAYEAVDPAEAKTEIDRLTLQIEMSYALTARLANLSILNFA